jgi:nucleoside permease NupC
MRKNLHYMEAAINGANEGVKMVLGIMAFFLAFLGIVILIEFLLSGVGLQLNDFTGPHIDW